MYYHPDFPQLDVCLTFENDRGKDLYVINLLLEVGPMNYAN